MCCYPSDFEAKFRTLLADQADAFFQSLAQPSVQGLRVNLCKTSANAFLADSGLSLTSVPSVSYTHLDVYKRQKHLRTKSVQCFCCNALSPVLLPQPIANLRISAVYIDVKHAFHHTCQLMICLLYTSRCV